MVAVDSSSSTNGGLRRRNSGGGGQVPPAAAATKPPSTWTVFIFHFALPMALLAVMSNINDIYSGIVSGSGKTTQETVELEAQLPQLSPFEVTTQILPDTQTTKNTAA